MEIKHTWCALILCFYNLYFVIVIKLNPIPVGLFLSNIDWGPTVIGLNTEYMY